jgi:hypothetical protein
MELNIASAAPVSHWPIQLRRLCSTISEFPLTAVVLLATSMGLITTLRYFAEIAYPLPDVGSLLTISGLITAGAIIFSLGLAVCLWMPLLLPQMGGIRLQWSDIAWAQGTLMVLVIESVFLRVYWKDLGSLWIFFIVVSTLIVLILLALRLKLWDRIKGTSKRERCTYGWVLIMCSLSVPIQGQAVNLLIEAMGGSSVLTTNERAFIFVGLLVLTTLVISLLSKVKPRAAFIAVLSVVVVLLFVGSVMTAALPKVLVTVVGIRIKGVSDLIISKETCARVQMVAKAQALKLGSDWGGKECAEHGAFLSADVQVHSGGRWLLRPRTIDDVEMPAAMARITAPDTAVELVLPTGEQPRP